MKNFLQNGLSELGKSIKRTAAEATSEASVRSLREIISRNRETAEDSARAIAHAPITRQAAVVVRTAASSGPVREVAFICGRAGVAGAVVDGAMGGATALRHLHAGKITGKQAVIHTSAEAGCGFITSSSGTAGTIAIYMLTGTMGPAALAAGMGASLGSRYVYRKIVGETLPNEDDAKNQNSKKDDKDDLMEDIGPKPQE
ncbi:MAG: hypothetical protein ACNA8W_16300 [Bradymonadaceae bacterium]